MADMALFARARQAAESGDYPAAALLFAQANQQAPSYLARANALAYARRSPTLLQRFSYSGDPASLAFNPDGRSLATADADGVRIWDLKAGQLETHLTSPHRIRTVIFTTDGGTLIAGDARGGLEWCELRDGKRRRRRAELPDRVNSLAISPDGRLLLATCSDGSTAMMDVADGRLIHRIPGGAGPVHDACFAGSERRLLVATEAGNVAVYDHERLEQPLALLEHGTSPILSVSCRRDGLMAVSSAQDGSSRLWDLRELIHVGPPLVHAGAATCTAFSPDGRWLATGSQDGTACLWEGGNGGATGIRLKHAGEIRRLAFSPGGTRLAIADSGGLHIWRVRAPGLQPWILSHAAPVERLEVDEQEQKLTAICADGSARVWSLKDGRRLGSAIRMPEAGSSDRSKVTVGGATLSGGADGAVTLRDGGRAWTSPHGAAVTHVALSADKLAAASASSDGKVRIWDEGGRPRGGFETKGLTGLAFGAGGRALVVSTAERTAQIRETASGEPIGPAIAPEGGSAELEAILSEGAKKIVTRAGDRRVYVWDAAHLFLETDADELLLRVRRQTGLGLDAAGEIAPLSVDLWSALKPRTPPEEPRNADAYATRAIHRYEHGDEEAAVSDLTRAVELNPRFAGALFERARIQSDREQIREALLDLDRALEIDPTFAEALVQRARLKWIRRDLQGARKDLDRALELSPDMAQALHERGRLRLEMGDPAGGAADLHWALELDPSLEEQVRALLPQAMGDPEAARQHFRKADGLAQKSQYREAIAEYDQAVEKAPMVALYYNDRGVARHMLGEFETALRDYRDAVRLDPRFAQAWSNIGLALKELGRFDEAIPPFEKTIQIDPDREVVTLWRIAECEAQAGLPARYPRISEVKRWFDSAVDAERSGDYSSAVASYSRAIGVQADLASLYLARGLAHERLNAIPAAFADIDQAIRIKPDYAAAFLMRGRIKINKEDFDGSIADSTEALKRDPDFAMAYNNRGAARMGLKKYAEAVEDCSRAIELDAELAMAWSNRGLSRFELGDDLGALADLRMSVRLESARYLRFRSKMSDCQMRLALRPRRRERPADDADLAAAKKLDQEGAAFIEKKEFEKAIEVLDRAIALVDDIPAFYFDRGWTRMSLRKTDEAIDDFKKSVELWPEFAMGLSNIANLYLEQSKTDEAAPYLERGLRIEPDSPYMHYHLARAHLQKKEYQKAIDEDTRALELWPEFPGPYWNRGCAKWYLEDWAGVIADMQRAVELDPSYKEDADQWIPKARASLEGKTEPVPETKKVETSRPGLPMPPDPVQRARIERAQASWNLFDFPSAARDLEEALRLGWREPEMLVMLAACREALQDFQGAMKAIDEAMAADPKRDLTPLIRASKQHIAPGGGEDPIAKAKEHIGRREFAQALLVLEKFLAQNPQRADAWTQKGMVLEDLGRSGEAEEAFTRALSIQPDDAKTLAGRAIVRLSLKKFREAIADCDEAERRGLADPPLCELRGRAKLLMGRPAEALADFDRALQKDPRYAAGQAARGDALAALGRWKEAIEAWEAAQALDASLAAEVQPKIENARRQGGGGFFGRLFGR